MAEHHPNTPLGFNAVIFDMDGVVTQTAKLHARAWKEMFDEYLMRRQKRAGGAFKPFEIRPDYLDYVDGKPRYEGVKSFLASRGIQIPYGDAADSPDRETICGLGNRKDQFIKEIIRKKGVEAYASTIALIHTLRSQGIRVGIVSSSENCGEILIRAGLDRLFDAQVDGITAKSLGLRGKPHPDIFIRCAALLGADPGDSVVMEDAIAGVQAGRAGGFGLVIGVARSDNHAALREHGADMVVSDLSELDLTAMREGFRKKRGSLPSALGRFSDLKDRLTHKQIVLFLDHDGTLAPIAQRPEWAGMTDAMRATVKRLAQRFPTAVVSGRSLADIRGLVRIDSLHYAGNHGLEISGPDGSTLRGETGKDFLGDIERVFQRLVGPVAEIEGAFVENKTYTLSVHYRQVPEALIPAVEALVDEALREFPRLRKHHGKKVFEIRPAIDWNKGKAVLWLLEALNLKRPDVVPIYIGDDVTDEDAFRALAGRGIGILVSDPPGKDSAAEFGLRDTEEVRRFLERLIDRIP